MEFYLNGKPKTLVEFDPNMTVLRYLRTQAGLKGTKEGCASGDCGACTVLVRQGSGTLLSINSCIALIGHFAGKHLYTVEGLVGSGSQQSQPHSQPQSHSQPDQGLHPVQQAMVDCHGSQCGFCTPGFVMSLAGLYENSVAAGLAEIEPAKIYDAISGNLCRCTGYRPILEAASKMLSYSAVHSVVGADAIPDSMHSFDAAETEITDTKADQRGYYLPGSEQQLQALLALYPGARLVAGGTDMVLEITQSYESHSHIIDLCAVDGLSQINIDQGYLHIGGAASYSDLEAEIEPLSEPFLALLHRLGSRQIRNSATLGGNIANGSPIADTPPVLMIWNAEVELVSSAGSRNWVSINDFYRGYKQTQLEPGHYIGAIRIALDEMARPHRIYKISKRFEDDISAVLGAFAIEVGKDSRLTEVRLAYGGVAATPVRAYKTEQYLRGRTLDKALLDQACEILATEFEPLSDVRASAAYRTEMILNLFRKAVAEILDGSSQNLMTEPVVLSSPLAGSELEGVDIDA